MSSELAKLFKSSEITVPSDVMEKYITLYKHISGESTTNAMSEVGGDWKPSQLKLVQAMTVDSMKPDTAKMGDFYYQGGLVKRPASVLVAYIYPTRVRFVKDVDKVPSCRSENVDMRGRGKLDKSKSVYADDCANCPFDEQPFSKGVPTNCSDVLNFVLVPESLETVFTLSLKSSAAQVGRRWIDMCRATAAPWSRFFLLDSEIRKRTTGGGQYAVPTVTPVADKVVPAHFAKFCADVISPQLHAVRQEAKALILRRNADVAAVLKVVDEGAAIRDSM